MIGDRVPVAMYCDGGCIGRNPSDIGGTWAWCTANSLDERIRCASGVVLPNDIGMEEVTNNISELWAMTCGLEALPDGWSGTVYSDSQVTIGRVFCGWRMSNIPHDLEARIAHARRRLGRINAIVLDGHPTRKHLREGRGKRNQPVSIHNVWCDVSCTEAGKAYRLRVGQ